MPSRVLLSLLAFICGMAIMYLFAAYRVFGIPDATPTIYTTIFVLIGLALIVTGWVRIFRRRPPEHSDP